MRTRKITEITNFELVLIVLIVQEYKYISSKRIAYFDSSKPQPHQFTILVHSIPVSAGGSISNNVQSFFMEYHPTTYLSHLVVQKTYIFSNLAVSCFSSLLISTTIIIAVI